MKNEKCKVQNEEQPGRDGRANAALDQLRAILIKEGADRDELIAQVRKMRETKDHRDRDRLGAGQ